MDNGTLVEVFKSLNYCQLAKTGLTSKRFRDLIRNNRHRLELHYVSIIRMNIVYSSHIVYSHTTKIFAKKLTPEEYSEWVIRNQYSKQIPLESRMAEIGSSLSEGCVYYLYANTGGALLSRSVPLSAKFKFCRFVKSRRDRNSGCIFSVHAELKNENWPLFQHFIRLLTDPFIYLHEVEFDFTAQKEAFNLLTGIINPDINFLQCHSMKLYTTDTNLDFPNLTKWAKYHLLCNKLEICIWNLAVNQDPSTHDETLLDLIMTGGHCTSALNIANYELSKVLLDLAEKFMDFKNGDECKVVQSSKGRINNHNVYVLKSKLGKFIVKEKLDVDDDEIKENVFEFINKDIDQKCQFTAAYY